MGNSTRGLREGRYGSRIEAYRETGGIAADAYSHCTEVLLYKFDLIYLSTCDFFEVLNSWPEHFCRVMISGLIANIYSLFKI
jgi:hypothetical protein